MSIYRTFLAILGLISALLLHGIAHGADEPATPAETATPPATEEAVPDPVAVVNGEPIPKALYEAYAQQRARQVGDVSSPEARKALTDELVVQELLIQSAEKQKLPDTPEVALHLQMARRNVLANAAVREFLKEHAPSEADIEKEYKAMTEQMEQKEYKARHILVESEDEAKKLIEEIDKGADFSELAKTHSTDGSGANGGDLGWFTADMMVQPFSDAVTKLEKGKHTEQPVQTQFGWHVIVLDDVRDATPPPLEQMQPQIMQNLQSRALNGYLTELREQAKVDIE